MRRARGPTCQRARQRYCPALSVRKRGGGGLRAAQCWARALLRQHSLHLQGKKVKRENFSVFSGGRLADHCCYEGVVQSLEREEEIISTGLSYDPIP